MNALESELRISRPAKPPKLVPGVGYVAPEPAVAAERRRRAREMPKTAPRTPTAAIPATTAPMITPMWEELLLFPFEGLLGADPDAESTRTLAGSTETADRKSTRLNSSHMSISYAVFCLKKKIKTGAQSSISKKKKTTSKDE